MALSINKKLKINKLSKKTIKNNWRYLGTLTYFGTFKKEFLTFIWNLK